MIDKIMHMLKVGAIMFVVILLLVFVFKGPDAGADFAEGTVGVISTVFDSIFTGAGEFFNKVTD